MMQHLKIRTLENISATEILECFNLAFSDYQTPTKLILAQLENKILVENILGEYSLGAFDNERLVGFILHGYDIINNKKALYNAGTGVIPEYRGQKLTERMYAFGLPQFKEEGIDSIRLEVITENLRAYKVYKRLGFGEKRTLCCYKGIAHPLRKPTEGSVRRIESYNRDELKSFWDYEPTWQNSMATIARNGRDTEIWGIYDDKEKLAGYIAYIPDRKRIQLFAVKPEYRRQGLASSLFGHITSVYDLECTVVNIDIRDTSTNNFLSSIGLSVFIQQYEMYLEIC